MELEFTFVVAINPDVLKLPTFEMVNKSANEAINLELFPEFVTLKID